MLGGIQAVQEAYDFILSNFYGAIDFWMQKWQSRGRAKSN